MKTGREVTWRERLSHPAALLLTVLVMGAMTWWLLALATPSRDAVQLRNALLAEMGEPADFSWTPDRPPPDFLLERGAVPDYLADVARTVTAGAQDDLGKALRIAAHLVAAEDARGDPIMSATDVTYERIRAGHAGYCSDFTQVFNGLAYAAGLAVREWGLAFEGFGNGHAFNEIYSRELGKWVFVDSFNSFYARDAASGEPLSALEFRDRVRAPPGRENVELVAIAPGRFSFRDDAMALDYYRRGADQFYLWWGNNVYSYDRHPLVRVLGPLSRSAEQAGAIIAGVHPHFRIAGTEATAPHFDDLHERRQQFSLALMTFVVATAALGGQLVLRYRRRRRPGQSAG